MGRGGWRQWYQCERMDGSSGSSRKGTKKVQIKGGGMCPGTTRGSKEMVEAKMEKASERREIRLGESGTLGKGRLASDGVGCWLAEL